VLKILLRLNAKIDKEAIALWQDMVRDSTHSYPPDEFAANQEATRLFEEAMGQGKRRYICDRVGCEKRAGKLMCANCARARYCSRACQRTAWKLHKEACRQMVSDRPPSMSFEPCREEDLDEEYRIRLTDPTADGGREPSSDEEEDSGSEASADAGAQPLAIAAPPDDGA